MYGHPQYPAFLRRVADHIGSDLADAQALDDMAAEIRRRPNPATCDCRERRNGFGFPVADPRPTPEGHDLHADWDPADQLALLQIQQATAAALDDYFGGGDVAWIVEEALWQVRARLVREGRCIIPCAVDLTLSQAGDMAAVPHPSLVREG